MGASHLKFYQVTGVNMNPEPEPKVYDMHCPAMNITGEVRHNYYAEMCLVRQQDENQRYCFGGCKYKKVTKSY